MPQLPLPLTFPEIAHEQPLLPVRMVNEFVYCPRLAYLEWVQGEWRASVDTVEGTHAHRRVDQPQGELPNLSPTSSSNAGQSVDAGAETAISSTPPASEGSDSPATLHARSVELSSAALGIIAKLDLVEAVGDVATPIDYKKGRRKFASAELMAPERVQLGAQALLLREKGFTVPRGIIFYVQSKERFHVEINDELVNETLLAIEGLRAMATGGKIPPPLENSPKCMRCSLQHICMPQEVNLLSKGLEPMRPLGIGEDEALPLIVQASYAYVRKVGDELQIDIDQKPGQRARMGEISQVVLMGNVTISTPALHELMERSIPVTWTTQGGWFYGHTVGHGHRNVELRTAQYLASFDQRHCLQIARGLVVAKIANARTFMRRNYKGDEQAAQQIADLLKRDQENAKLADSIESLLGFEGSAASRYFGEFRELLRPPGDGVTDEFEFSHRTRRPPTDPVNALLSFAYSMLMRTVAMSLSAVGFDPFRGFYHQPRYGRMALALDVMEPFRPILADSVVIQAINTGEVRGTDFERAGNACALRESGRKRFMAAFERRLSTEIVHPLFGYKLSYRRLIELQCRLLGRHLLGEIPDYPNFTVR
jgi:CRISP-associated protein Cas1